MGTCMDYSSRVQVLEETRKTLEELSKRFPNGSTEAYALGMTAHQFIGDLLLREQMLHERKLLVVPNEGIGELSDGYHTFNELYHHRALLFATICNSNKDIAWKARKHDDGSMYDGMFIVGITTPEGQATYHYDIDPYWDMFDVEEFEYAPAFDGHTPEIALNRIFNLTKGGRNNE